MSTRQPFPESLHYRTEIRAILALHRLWLEGKGESPEADVLRDATDGAWELLSDAERKRIRGLSEDLNSTSEQVTNESAEPLNPQAQAKLAEATEARDRGEWDRALELVRRWGKHAAPAMLAFMRGSVWLGAGDREVAVTFFEHASRIDPTNARLRTVLLGHLKTVEPNRAVAQAESILGTATSHDAGLVVQAAEVVYASAGNATPEQTVSTCERLIPLVEVAVQRLQADPDGDALATFAGLVMLGACYRTRGDTQAAVRYYSQALQMDPSNAPLYSARGILLYGSSPRAISDFELSIQLGFQEAWPYFFLAHHLVTHGRFEECRSMCERGLRLPAPSRVKSELLDWLAISQAELRFPQDLVRAAFENAVRSDPSNDQARRNFGIYEEVEKGHTSIDVPWEKTSPSIMRSFGEEQTRRGNGQTGRQPVYA
jgi:tetratricopeptide (TPR) repeat protein